MNKVFHLFALVAFSINLFGATIPVKFLNSTDAIIAVAGNSNPDEPDNFLGKGWSVKPKAEVTVVATASNPRIAFWEDSKPEAAFVYGFKNQAGKKSIDVRIVLSKGAYKLEPQTTYGFKRFDEKDIVPYRGVCATTQYHRCPQARVRVQPTAAD